MDEQEIIDALNDPYYQTKEMHEAFSKVAQNLADKVDEMLLREMEKLNSFPIQQFIEYEVKNGA